MSNKLAQAIKKHAPAQGIFQSAITELAFMRMDTVSSTPSPIVYEPSVYIVAQGSKTASLAGELYTYNALNYLVLSLPLPLQCEVTMASAERPFLALKLSIRPELLSELVIEIERLASPKKQAAKARQTTERGMYVAAMSDTLSSAVIRLINTLDDAAAIKLIAPLVIKEILFHLLKADQADQLKAFVCQDRNDYRICNSVNYIQKNFHQPLEIEQLASLAGMSPSSFHHYFKLVTNASPLQYIKSMRLHAARSKILLNSLSVGDAAFQVGYTSPSQFSREYKRFFGTAPSLDAHPMLS